MVYVTASEIREMSSISSTQMNDGQLDNSIKWACYEFNEDTQILVEEEKIEFLSDKKSFLTNYKYLGDMNDDFEVTVDDVQVWYLNDDKERVYLTVSSIDSKEGKVTLSAESDKECYVKYVYSKGLLDPIDKNMKLAALQNCAAWAFSKINVGKAPRFRMDQLTVFRDTEAHKYWKKQYQNTLTKIHTEWLVRFSDKVSDKIRRENEYDFV